MDTGRTLSPEKMPSRTETHLRHRTGLLVLALATFAVVTTEMLPVGLLPAIGATFGERESTAGLLVSLYGAMVAVLAVPLTIATRAIARKRLLVVATLLFAVSNVAAGLAPAFAALAAARALGGATHALFFSVCIGYAARLVPPASAGRALALVSAGAAAGFVLGVPLATALGTAVGWRGAFLALAVLMALVLGAILALLPPVSSDPGETEAVPARRKRLAAAVGSNALAYLGHYTIYTYISVILLAAGAGRGAVGPILLLFGGAGLVALLVVGPRLDRRPRRSAATALTLVVVGIAGVAAGFPTLAPVVVAGALWNGAFAPMASIYQAAAVRAGAVSPDLAGAFVNATANVGIGGGAALGALVLHQGGTRALAGAAAICLLAAVAVVLGARRTFAGG